MSEWVGRAGQRYYFPSLTYTFTTSAETQYGTRTLYKFEDGRGNVFVWWTGSRLEVVLGSEVEGYAVVKGHDTYNGVKQTILKNCVLALKGAGQMTFDFGEFLESDEQEDVG